MQLAIYIDNLHLFYIFQKQIDISDQFFMNLMLDFKYFFLELKINDMFNDL